jgi:hypothetical protein
MDNAWHSSSSFACRLESSLCRLGSVRRFRPFGRRTRKYVTDPIYGLPFVSTPMAIMNVDRMTVYGVALKEQRVICRYLLAWPVAPSAYGYIAPMATTIPDIGVL